MRKEAVVCVIKIYQNILPVGPEEKHESPPGRVADLESPQYKERLGILITVPLQWLGQDMACVTQHRLGVI
jgi:hypothetical protein